LTLSALTYLRPLPVLLVLLTALLMPCASVAALSPQPLPTGINAYVMDQAGMLDPEMEQKLTAFLRQFEHSDSTQVVVVTVPSLQGREISEYSIELATNSGLGQKKLDNGVLLLVARAERKVRIEVGKGLEGELTDLRAGRIIDTEITPLFKQGRFAAGIAAGVEAIVASIRGEYSGAGADKNKERNPFGWLIILLFLVPGLLPFGSRRGRSGFIFFPGGFGGGRGGSGGFSGGGGGFGGGGASGSW